MLEGRIHSFESFGTVDGPGIRFVVFMQGCPLRCIYCHNRDTWDVSGGQSYTIDEVMEKISKYKNYIKFSGGGITVTGGEPTLQAEFVTELFKKCKDEHIHTALDTSGYTDINRVMELLQYTDLVLLDVKQAVEEKHKEVTGVGLEKIHRFSSYVSEKGIPIWIRYVLVPGYTDNEQDLMLAADFIKGLKSVERVEVLPYHNLGEFKWDRLDKEYKLAGVQSPSADSVKKAQHILWNKAEAAK